MVQAASLRSQRENPKYFDIEHGDEHNDVSHVIYLFFNLIIC